MEKDIDSAEVSNTGMDPPIDTEGGNAHLVDVIALNTLNEVIVQAKEELEEDEGSFRIPTHIHDALLIKCERMLLNYGETAAHDSMIEEIQKYLEIKKLLRDRDDERKVRKSLPKDTLRP